MNRNGRRKLEKSVRSYCMICMQALATLSHVINEMQEQEEEKLDHIPDNLKDSSLAESLDEAIQTLIEISELLEDAKENCDSIAECADIQLTDRIPEPRNQLPDTDPRVNRFQILLSDYLMMLMKLRAEQLGISCNELVCRTLLNELTKDPNV